MKCSISLIIPFSRPSNFSDLLRRIQGLRYDGPYEVLIVLNNVDNWFPSEHLDNHIRLLHCKTKGPSAARNYGIAAARYQYQVFVDDDCEFDSTLLKKYSISWSKKPQASILGGRVAVKIAGNNIALSVDQQSLLVEFGWCFGQLDYGNYAHACSLEEPLFSANFGIKQQKKAPVFFPESLGKVLPNKWVMFGEDCLLCYQSILSKRLVWYDPDLVVNNVIDSSRLSKQYVLKRVFLAGIERCNTDRLLRKNPLWQSYQYEVVAAIKKAVHGHFSQFRNLFAHYGVVHLLGFVCGCVGKF